MTYQYSHERLVWLDLETTGLDPQTDHILEIATLITDGELNEIRVGPVLAIRTDETILLGMQPWCCDVHGASGLTEECRRSSVSLAEAEERTLGFLANHLEPKASPLCGNSVWYDRAFLLRCMPNLERYFHYRCLDVSAINEFAKRYRPEVAAQVHKGKRHRALADIRESIAELRLYRKALQPAPESRDSRGYHGNSARSRPTVQLM